MRCLITGTVLALFCISISQADAAKFKVTYNLLGQDDGARPTGDLTRVGKLLYGTALSAGSAEGGVLFALDPKTGIETVLHSFGSGSEGSGPQGGLLRIGTTLYGTTIGGGSAEFGTVFSYDLQSSTLKTVYAFQGGSQDGTFPSPSLVAVADAGTAFEVTP